MKTAETSATRSVRKRRQNSCRGERAAISPGTSSTLSTVGSVLNEQLGAPTLTADRAPASAPQPPPWAQQTTWEPPCHPTLIRPQRSSWPDTLLSAALVAQRIEHAPPKRGMQVRFLPGAFPIAVCGVAVAPWRHYPRVSTLLPRSCVAGPVLPSARPRVREHARSTRRPPSPAAPGPRLQLPRPSRGRCACSRAGIPGGATRRRDCPALGAARLRGPGRGRALTRTAGWSGVIRPCTAEPRHQRGALVEAAARTCSPFRTRSPGTTRLRLWMITAVAVSLAGVRVRRADRLPADQTRRPSAAGPESWPRRSRDWRCSGIQNYSHYVLSAQSDPMIVSLCLGAIDCHLSRRPRAAFVLGVLASLGRPEAWPFLACTALWIWLALPRSTAGWWPAAGWPSCCCGSGSPPSPRAPRSWPPANALGLGPAADQQPGRSGRWGGSSASTSCRSSSPRCWRSCSRWCGATDHAGAGRRASSCGWWSRSRSSLHGWPGIARYMFEAGRRDGGARRGGRRRLLVDAAAGWPASPGLGRPGARRPAGAAAWCRPRSRTPGSSTRTCASSARARPRSTA